MSYVNSIKLVQGPTMHGFIDHIDKQFHHKIKQALPEVAKMLRAEAQARIPEDTGKTSRSIRAYARPNSLSVNLAVLYSHRADANLPQMLEDGTAKVGRVARIRRLRKGARTGKTVGKRYLARAGSKSFTAINRIVRAHLGDLTR